MTPPPGNRKASASQLKSDSAPKVRERLVLWVSMALFGLFVSVSGVAALVDLEVQLAKMPPGESGEGLRDWLQRAERAFAATSLFERWRKADQNRLARSLGMGNARVVIGRDGTLHYRADVEAVIGKGPTYEEPPSVARESVAEKWISPLAVIEEFAADLSERGIRLVLVPVPTKAMVNPPAPGATPAPHPQHRQVLERLRSSGVEVVDLFEAFDAVPGTAPHFLREDTHWTPRAMEVCADFVANHLKAFAGGKAAEGKGSLRARFREFRLTHRGDLRAMLDLPLESGGGGTVSLKLRQVVDSERGEPLRSEAGSPYVLLGDSFANVFEDPSLGFAHETSGWLAAGFPSHLAARLGVPLHVIAINGGGATAARRRFATLPDEEIRSKKTVLWLLSARDLFLSATPARRAGIEWQRVDFSPIRPSAAGDADSYSASDPSGEGARPGEITLTGVLRKRSAVGDPHETSYESALYSCLFEVVEVESGNFLGGEAYVFLTAFREREWVETARLETGSRYRLHLVPFPSQGEIASLQQVDDLFLEAGDLARFYAIDAEKVE